MGGRKLPQELIDQICDAIDNSDDHFDSRYHFRALDTVPSYERQSRRDLKNLRLAGKTTCEAANPHFFRHFNARCPAKGRQLAADWRHSLLEFSRRPWVKLVQTLRIGTAKQHVRFHGEETTEESMLIACAYAVPTFARVCTSLRAISVAIDTADMAFTAENKPSWQRQLLLLTVESTLRECCPSLKTLELSLPLTADLGALHTSISKVPELRNLHSQVTSISVTVNDATGPEGVRYWSEPESDNQRRFPNQRHQGGLWNLVQLAPALEALSVRCPHVLNFDQVSMAGFQCLQELRLMRVAVSGLRLSHIAQRSMASLRAVELRLVELNSGTWSEVLHTFCELRGLINFDVDSCGYSATGSSSHYQQRLLPEPDNPQAIETLNFPEDYNALGAVQRHVNSLRAARSMSQYTEYDYRFMTYSRSD